MEVIALKMMLVHLLFILQLKCSCTGTVFLQHWERISLDDLFCNQNTVKLLMEAPGFY